MEEIKVNEYVRTKEGEIIKYIKDEIENETDTYHWFDNLPENKTRKQIEESINAHQGLLDLYNKEKEKNKKAIEYINKNCSTNNCDFMDDGVGNLFKDILELLEERN